MANATLETRIGQALNNNLFASLATVEGEKPRVRYMALYHDGLDIYMATDRKTDKVEEIQQNPNVFVLMGYEKGGTGDVLEISGTAEVTGDQDLKSKVWREDFKRWFNGPEDPDFVVLKITPNHMEMTDVEGQRQTWTP